jgi:hypothetical protein
MHLINILMKKTKGFKNSLSLSLSFSFSSLSIYILMLFCKSYTQFVKKTRKRESVSNEKI